MEFIESRLIPLRQAGRLIGPGTSLGYVGFAQSVFALHSGYSKLYTEEIPVFTEWKETAQYSLRPGLTLDLYLTLPVSMLLET